MTVKRAGQTVLSFTVWFHMDRIYLDYFNSECLLESVVCHFYKESSIYGGTISNMISNMWHVCQTQRIYINLPSLVQYSVNLSKHIGTKLTLLQY